MRNIQNIKRQISERNPLVSVSKDKRAGFTIVELLIVIVVIGILAAIVLNTFSGVQARARNTHRQTDMKSLANLIELFYASPTNANPSNYPLASTIVSPQTVAQVQTVLPGMDPNALATPIGTGNNLNATATPTSGQHGYLAYQAGTTTVCTTASTCGTYALYWTEEAANGAGGGTFTKAGLNK